LGVIGPSRSVIKTCKDVPMVEVSGAVWMQFALSALGIIIMVAVAGLLAWYKRAEGRSPGSRPKKTPDADLAGGEA